MLSAVYRNLKSRTESDTTDTRGHALTALGGATIPVYGILQRQSAIVGLS